MSKKIKFIFITNIVVTAISVLLLLSVLFINQLSVEYVTTEEDAVAIGKIVCKSVYRDFNPEKYYWGGYYNPSLDAWCVGCSTEPEAKILGGGLPDLWIKKMAK